MKTRVLVILGAFFALVLLVLLGSYIFLVFPNTANTALGVEIQRLYNLTLLRPLDLQINSLGADISVVQTVKDPRDKSFISYLYLVRGKYSSINFQNQMLTLVSASGNTYNFRFNLNPDDTFSYKQGLPDKSKSLEKNFIPITNDFQSSPFKKGDTLIVQWEDKRTLAQIIETTQSDPNKLLDPFLSVSDFSRVVLEQ